MVRLLLLFAGLVVLGMLLLTIISSEPGVPRERFDLKRLSQVRPTEQWFRDQVLSNPKTVLVDFGAEWCGPCKILDQTLQEILQNYGDRLDVVKVDIDRERHLARDYEVGPIPFVLVFKAGQVVAAERGMVFYEGIEQLIKPHLGEAVPVTSPAKAEATQSANPTVQ